MTRVLDANSSCYVRNDSTASANIDIGLISVHRDAIKHYKVLDFSAGAPKSSRVFAAFVDSSQTSWLPGLARVVIRQSVFELESFVSFVSRQNTGSHYWIRPRFSSSVTFAPVLEASFEASVEASVEAARSSEPGKIFSPLNQSEIQLQIEMFMFILARPTPPNEYRIPNYPHEYRSIIKSCTALKNGQRIF